MQKSNFRKYTHKIISAIRRLLLMCRHGNVRIFPRSGTPPHVCACACMILTTIWFRWIHVPAEDNKPVNLITSQNHGQCPAHLRGRKMAAWIGARDPCAALAVFVFAIHSRRPSSLRFYAHLAGRCRLHSMAARIFHTWPG